MRLERRADWLALATRLVQLHSRLLFPESPADSQAAAAEVAAEIGRVEELIFLRAAAGRLGNRPQLGIDMAESTKSLREFAGFMDLDEEGILAIALIATF